MFLHTLYNAKLKSTSGNVGVSNKVTPSLLEKLNLFWLSCAQCREDDFDASAAAQKHTARVSQH